MGGDKYKKRGTAHQDNVLQKKGILHHPYWVVDKVFIVHKNDGLYRSFPIQIKDRYMSLRFRK